MGVFNLKELMSKFQIRDKKILNVMVWVIVGIIILIAMSGFGNKDSKKGVDTSVNTVSGAGVNVKEYAAGLEKQMAETLSKIQGAGKVSVMLTFENGGERVVASDSKSTEQHNKEGAGAENVEGDKKNSYSVQREDKVVLYGKQSSEEQPLVLKEVMPKILGVLVLAEGAGDEKVKFELYEAARAVSGAPPHRVKVAHYKAK